MRERAARGIWKVPDCTRPWEEKWWGRKREDEKREGAERVPRNPETKR